MDLQNFCLNLITNNLPKLIGRRIYVCDLDFILTNFLTNQQITESNFDIETIVDCVGDIINPTNFVQNNWDEQTLITQSNVTSMLNEIKNLYYSK